MSAKAELVTQGKFQEIIAMMDKAPLVNRGTIVTGWSLQMSDPYTVKIAPLTGDQWKIIKMVNIEIIQIPEAPREVFLWVMLPELISDNYSKQEAPYHLEVMPTDTGRKKVKFQRDVNLEQPIEDQINDFIDKALIFYLMYCEQPAPPSNENK